MIVNPKGPSRGSYRITRGVGWDYDGVYLVFSFRPSLIEPGDRNDNFGLRIVRNARKV